MDGYAAQLVVGVGGRAGVSVAEVCALVEETLRGAGLPSEAVTALATVESKAGEPGITGAAERFGVPLLSYPAEELASVAVPHPSETAREAAGTPSVAEAAALAGGGELLVPKRRSVAATCAVATLCAHDLRHHGDAEVAGAGAALVDLAVNVRSDTPPAWLKQRIAASLDDLAAYPDGRQARAAVAARHGLPVERVLLTAGAAEAFVLIARALGAERPVVVHPQFTEPEAALRDAGHRVGRVVLRPEDGFRLDPAAVPEDADLVVIGNPTNPTSVLHPAAALAALARPGRILVVDEAFMDAVPGEQEALAGRTDLPGLVVLRSLTKTWGLAGLRIGYVLAEPEVIAKLGACVGMLSLSSASVVAAVGWVA
ncbi:Rv2231c family pyridoxal phosphate-dependent protein CobC, partial [Streptomyces xanthophaeus]|uniref:Rv2231c family pyridoxal phosphate-dependent protein CobC n=1 Tax=Streptomyces xanthophaeus TaxID=67385 RepID=UPI003650CBFE